MTARFSDKARFRLAADAAYVGEDGSCGCEHIRLVAYSQGHSLPWIDPDRTSARVTGDFVASHPVWYHHTEATDFCSILRHGLVPATLLADILDLRGGGASKTRHYAANRQAVYLSPSDVTSPEYTAGARHSGGTGLITVE